MNDYKKDFFMPEGIYLLSHSLGCLPRRAEVEEQANFFKGWKTEGANIWPVWLDKLEQFCQALSTLFKAEANEFCPQTNISSSLSKILLSLPTRKERNKLLISQSDFPSMGFTMQAMQSLGYQVQTRPITENQLSIDSWKPFLSKQTQLLLITHVTYSNSSQNPVKEIIRAAKENGIFTVVDIAQSAGVVPIDFKAWDADFVIGSSVKWLCGGPGAAYLWANPKTVDKFRPLDVGWFSHEDPFEFDINNFRYAKTAKRFWGGTPSVAPFVIAQAGLKYINSIGVAKIREYNQQLNKQLVEAALAKNINVLSPLDPAKRGGTVALSFKDSEQALAAFKQEKVLIDSRPTVIDGKPELSLRFSPHIYNSQDEIERVIAVMNRQA